MAISRILHYLTTDEDTFSDYDERIMGTNPNDALSSLRITHIVREDARKTDSITWYSVLQNLLLTILH